MTMTGDETSDERGPDIGERAELGPPLRARRRDLRLSQRQVAARAGVGHSTVARLESGRLDVRLDLVIAVLRAAGLGLGVRGPDGRPFTLSRQEVEDLDMSDTGGVRRRPAHLPHEIRRGLPLWTFGREMRTGNPRILDTDPYAIYRRTSPIAITADHPTDDDPGLCHAGAMEAAPVDHVEHRFYRDLAPWWPLISPVEGYEEDAAFVATLLYSAGIGVREVLELGSGGGHHAAHLSRHFTMTLVDLSPHMLDVSRALNPECRHLVGDMRSARLDESFDAVFVHDAVDYMTTEDDLRAAVATAYAHCRPGGMAVFLPGRVRETFVVRNGSGGADGADGRSARFHSWTWDPDPADSWVLTTYAFVLRHPDGHVDLCHETHRTGLFSRDVWLAVLGEAGFEASAIEDEPDDDRAPRTVFVGHRPRS
jgi:SAM-dependent methyltransferase/transcriptional regulator with XRE-family HTH domain